MLACSCHDNWGMPRKPGRAGKPNFVSMSPLWPCGFYIPEPQNIFQWRFASPRSITWLLSALPRAEREKDTPEEASRWGWLQGFLMNCLFGGRSGFHTHTHTHRVTCFVPCITISLRPGWWEDHKAHQNSSRAVPLCLQSHRIPESARLENTSKTESKLCPIPSLPEQRAGHLQGWALHSCPNI